MSEFLAGKKTYITAATGILVSGLYAMGYIDKDTFELLVSVAGFFGITFLRKALPSS